LKLFDTHTHYTDRAYKGKAGELIKQMLSDNVAGFVAVGYCFDSIPKSIKLAERYNNVYASVGIHPHYAKENLPTDYAEQLRNYATDGGNTKIVAIGEAGLDYHYDDSEKFKSKQKEVFLAQLDLARELNLPIIIHSRDAANDTLEILRKEFLKNPDLKAVMHCYTGSVEMARVLIKLGVLISFTGVLTFKNAKKSHEVCREIPLNRIMLETDCPYMAPEPFRGKTCDSSMAWNTAEKIAEIKGVTLEEVVKSCNANAKWFFKIEF